MGVTIYPVIGKWHKLDAYPFLKAAYETDGELPSPVPEGAFVEVLQLILDLREIGRRDPALAREPTMAELRKAASLMGVLVLGPDAELLRPDGSRNVRNQPDDGGKRSPAPTPPVAKAALPDGRAGQGEENDTAEDSPSPLLDVLEFQIATGSPAPFKAATEPLIESRLAALQAAVGRIELEVFGAKRDISCIKTGITQIKNNVGLEPNGGLKVTKLHSKGGGSGGAFAAAAGRRHSTSSAPPLAEAGTKSVPHVDINVAIERLKLFKDGGKAAHTVGPTGPANQPSYVGVPSPSFATPQTGSTPMQRPLGPSQQPSHEPVRHVGYIEMVPPSYAGMLPGLAGLGQQHSHSALQQLQPFYSVAPAPTPASAPSSAASATFPVHSSPTGLHQPLMSPRSQLEDLEEGEVEEDSGW